MRAFLVIAISMISLYLIDLLIRKIIFNKREKMSDIEFYEKVVKMYSGIDKEKCIKERKYIGETLWLDYQRIYPGTTFSDLDKYTHFMSGIDFDCIFSDLEDYGIDTSDIFTVADYIFKKSKL